MEVSWFIKEINSYIHNVNEIDDETMKLLVEMTVAVNKLQINARFRENKTTIENNFFDDKCDKIFECRRYIVCRLCHVSAKKIFV